MRALWLVILLNACGSVNTAQPDAGTGDIDSSIPIDASLCFGGGLVQLCLSTLPGEALVFDASRQIDTDRDSRCTSFTPANPAWCVISATRLTVSAGATLSAVGQRPLVLVATEGFQVDGTIDVASHLSANLRIRGAGSTSNSCSASSGAVWPGAGAGGTFRSRGGNGGTATGGTGGAVSGMPVAVTTLRGGCNGGDGAPSDPNPGGQGGHGGGAVYLLGPSITVARTGVINASGSGGQTASDSATGAGGGGSGGMIGLDAPAIQLAAGARLFANGGGGGEGSGCPEPGQDTSGASGQDPNSPTVPAPGGRREPNGGDGGDGALSTAAGARGGDGNACFPGVFGGGGGGGGGVGAILLRGTVTDIGAQISPPAVAMP